jgi:succinyl-CoA synthetase beta subunit
MFTTEGGVDIEEVAEKSPAKLVRLHVDPLEGFQPWHGRRLVFGAGVADPDEQKQVLAIAAKLYACFVACDAMLCEINPLVVTPEGEVRALDSKFTIDDNALFRHPDIAEMRDLDAYPAEERAARAKDVTYVKLDGEVAEGVVDALEVIVADPQVRAILFNVFGGITRCDEVARGILTALERMQIDHPIVVRLDGTNADEGRRLLADAAPPNLHVEPTMLDAAKRAVELAA